MRQRVRRESGGCSAVQGSAARLQSPGWKSTPVNSTWLPSGSLHSLTTCAAHQRQGLQDSSRPPHAGVRAAPSPVHLLAEHVAEQQLVERGFLRLIKLKGAVEGLHALDGLKHVRAPLHRAACRRRGSPAR